MLEIYNVSRQSNLFKVKSCQSFYQYGDSKLNSYSVYKVKPFNKFNCMENDITRIRLYEKTKFSFKISIQIWNFQFKTSQINK